MRCSILTDAVTQHNLRGHAPAAPQASKRILDDEQCWLREARLVDGSIVAFYKNQIAYVQFEQWFKQLCASIERVAKNFLRFVKAGRHTYVLAALSAEQKGDGTRTTFVLRS